MNTFLNFWRSAHTFVIKNFLILLLPLGIWGFFEIPNPTPFISNQYSQESFGRGGGIEMTDMSMKRSMVADFIAPEAEAQDGFDAREDSEKKVVKNGNIDLRADDTEVLRSEIELKIKNFSGKIQNVSSWQVRDGALGYNITARIPSEKFDDALLEIGKMGEKTGENISSQDITRQYYDTENQLKNLEARRERLRELMKFNTKNLADVLSVDREITSVQTQIERLTNLQRTRDTDVSFSVLRIGIQPFPQIGDTGNPYWSVKGSWRTAVNNLIQKSHLLFDWALKYIVLAPIWIPVLLILIWTKRRFWRRNS